ncbi:MAG TPA: hypothetical protein VHY36_06240 [Steroidobacteraceae bacterium]|jgi:hypothetical protein|nr:hypothetical protein [Steroidobacteraceae bacterium]
MERFNTIFFRVWIALAIAVDLIGIATLFMSEDSPWAVTRRFALLLTVPAPAAYAWLHRRRKLAALGADTPNG